MNFYELDFNLLDPFGHGETLTLDNLEDLPFPIWSFKDHRFEKIYSAFVNLDLILLAYEIEHKGKIMDISLTVEKGKKKQNTQQIGQTDLYTLTLSMPYIYLKQVESYIYIVPSSRKEPFHTIEKLLSMDKKLMDDDMSFSAYSSLLRIHEEFPHLSWMTQWFISGFLQLFKMGTLRPLGYIESEYGQDARRNYTPDYRWQVSHDEIRKDSKFPKMSIDEEKGENEVSMDFKNDFKNKQNDEHFLSSDTLHNKIGNLPSNHEISSINYMEDETIKNKFRVTDINTWINHFREDFGHLNFTISTMSSSVEYKYSFPWRASHLNLFNMSRFRWPLLFCGIYIGDKENIEKAMKIENTNLLNFFNTLFPKRDKFIKNLSLSMDSSNIYFLEVEKTSFDLDKSFKFSKNKDLMVIGEQLDSPEEVLIAERPHDYNDVVLKFWTGNSKQSQAINGLLNFGTFALNSSINEYNLNIEESRKVIDKLPRNVNVKYPNILIKSSLFKVQLQSYLMGILNAICFSGICSDESSVGGLWNLLIQTNIDIRFDISRKLQVYPKSHDYSVLNTIGMLNLGLNKEVLSFNILKKILTNLLKLDDDIRKFYSGLSMREAIPRAIAEYILLKYRSNQWNLDQLFVHFKLQLDIKTHKYVSAGQVVKMKIEILSLLLKVLKLYNYDPNRMDNQTKQLLMGRAVFIDYKRGFNQLEDLVNRQENSCVIM